jgi:hypothetical protein
VRLALLVVATFVLASCNSIAGTTESEGALMAAQSRGGMCIEGMCETTIYLERNGLIHSAAKPPNELGIVPAETMAELEAQIAAADFDEIRSHPFTGTCPTAFDGQEVVFEFQTADGVERIESCQSAVDFASPLFKAVATAVGAYLPLAIDQPIGPDNPQPPPDTIER